MKKPIDFLILLAPALLWLLSSILLGDDFALPNRLMLAILCTAAGAGALVMNRKIPGFFALVAGVGMLAAVPVEHEMPDYTLHQSTNNTVQPMPSLGGYSEESIRRTARYMGDVGVALVDSGWTNAPMNTALIVSASEVVGCIHHGLEPRNGGSQGMNPPAAPTKELNRQLAPTINTDAAHESRDANG